MCTYSPINAKGKFITNLDVRHTYTLFKERHLNGWNPHSYVGPTGFADLGFTTQN